MWKMENEQAMQNPIETVLFAPFFILEAMMRGLEPKREVKEVELKEPEVAVPLRIRSENTRERKMIFGMWGSGF